MNKRTLEEAFKAPKNITAEAQAKWNELAAVLKGDVYGGISSILAVVSPDDNTRNQIVSLARDRAIAGAAHELAESNKILELSPSLLAALLNIPHQELRQLSSAASISQKIGMITNEDDAISIVNQASVIAVMEPDEGKCMEDGQADSEYSMKYP